MAPYLFVLAIDYFSKLLGKLHSSPQFKYHPKCKALKLVHLSFADGMMLFCKGDVVSPLILKGYVDQFANTSGLHVNLHKSRVFFCGVNEHLKGILLNQLGFSEGSLPIKYLGLPLIVSKLTVIDCGPILDRMRSKISSGSARLLSYAGRLVLIKSVLFHYQVYWSNAFLLPKGVIFQIEALYRNYLWSGVVDRKNMALVAWENVSLPRSECCLGLLQISAWNKAVFGKLLWKIIANRHCLWTRWVNAVYLKGISIWCVEAKDSHPWAWKKLLQLRGMIKNHVSYTLGDGRQISLFYDQWLQSGPIIDKIGDSAYIWGENLTVDSWWNPRGEWNMPRSFCRRFLDIVAEICSFSITDMPDTVTWKPNPIKDYQVNDTYELCRKRGSRVNWDKIVWSANIPPDSSFVAGFCGGEFSRLEHFWLVES